MISYAYETENEQEEVTETRNNIFWYGFGQGLIQGLTTVPGYLGRWLHELWEYILRRIDVHKDYEVHTFTEEGDEARKPKDGDAWTTMLYDEVFIPYHVGEAAQENYVQTSYVNDVNWAYVETLAEYRIDQHSSSAASTEDSDASIYEYGLRRLSYTDTASGELFTYLYDGRGSVSNVTSQSGVSVLSYVYDAYGIASVYSSTASGNVSSGISNPYGYNGEFTDPATGFQYLRSRYYNSITGNFLTEDTYSGSILEPLSQNRYTYTGNNPVNLRDPSGHAWISGTAAKVAAAAKKTTSKPNAVKSSAATAVKNATKKAVTVAKNTATKSSQTNKGTSNQNTKGNQTAATKFLNASMPSASTAGNSSGSGKIKSSATKLTWQQSLANSMGGGTGTVRQITTGHTYINNKLFTAISAKEQKQCSNAARLTKNSEEAESNSLKEIGNKIKNLLRKTTAGFVGLATSLYGNLILATEPVNIFSKSMFAALQLVGYTADAKLGEMEYFLAGQIVGDKVSFVMGNLIQAAGKTVKQLGTALDLYLLFNYLGGGGAGVGQIIGGGSIALEGTVGVAGVGTVAGTLIGGVISSFGGNLKDNAEKNEALHEEQLKKLSEEKSGIYKEVNVHRQIFSLSSKSSFGLPDSVR